MLGPLRALGALAGCLSASALGVSGCGAGSTSSHTANSSSRAPQARPRILAEPAGLIAGSAPQPNGTLWVLAGSSRARTIHEIQLPAGSELRTVGVSAQTRALAESSTRILALGLAGRSSGAVELLDGAGGPKTTIPVGGRVRALAYGDDGVTLYALDATGRSQSVTVIDATTHRVRRTIGLPVDAQAITPAPDQRTIWSVQSSGSVQETSLPSGHVIENFPVGGHGLGIATSPSGQTLYVLKATAGADEVAIVHVATEQVEKVVPVAAHSVAVATSLDGAQLYDFVGSARDGNIQILTP